MTLETLVHTAKVDGYVVTQRGAVVDGAYLGTLRPDTPHALMSGSKTMVGMLSAMLTNTGELEPNALVGDVIHELRDTPYGSATAAHLLSMTSGVRWDASRSMAALGWTPNALQMCRAFVPVVQQMARQPRSHARWLAAIAKLPKGPTQPALPLQGLGTYPALRGAGQSRPHGSGFDYKGSDTAVLGWLLERASGKTMTALLHERLWSPLGLAHAGHMIVDPLHAAMHEGGLSMTLEDAARVNMLMLHGRMPAGKALLPDSWLYGPAVHGTMAGWSDTLMGQPFVGSGFTHQHWLPDMEKRVRLAFGAHGQLMWADPNTDVTVTVFSHWTAPQCHLFGLWMQAAQALSHALK